MFLSIASKYLLCTKGDSSTLWCASEAFGCLTSLIFLLTFIFKYGAHIMGVKITPVPKEQQYIK